jgi:homeobox protein cut-like
MFVIAIILRMRLSLISNAAINLTALVPSLDATASDIVAHQRDSLVQRKDLAQKTKDFRKLDDAAKLIEIKGLLKGIPSAHTIKSPAFVDIPC